MKMFLIGFFSCYCVASLLIFLAKYYGWDFATDAFIRPWCALAIVVLFLPCITWGLLRNVVRPVEQGAVDKLMRSGLRVRRLLGRLCLCHDKSAKKWWNRAFFIRVKKEADGK